MVGNICVSPFSDITLTYKLAHVFHMLCKEWSKKTCYVVHIFLIYSQLEGFVITKLQMVTKDHTMHERNFK